MILLLFNIFFGILIWY